MTKKYLKVGHIVNSFGLKGELKVVTESDFIEERFKKGSKIYFKYHNDYQLHIISSMRLIKNNPMITLDEKYDINQVLNYIGQDIYVDSADNHKLKDNEYFIDELIGKKVYDEDSNFIGILNDIIILPSNDVMEIKKDNGEIILAPFINDFIIDIKDDIIIKKYEVENAL